jgi:DNA-directed RNA polymerase specialized sigma24 family protein
MDSDAFERLKYGGEKEIRILYEAFLTAFVRYISSAFRCSQSKAAEIYPEAFSILYFNIKQGKLAGPLTSTMQTYLNSTGWNLYHRRFLDKYNRDKVLSDPSELTHPSRSLVDEAILQQERAFYVRAFLEKLGEPCKSLLYQVYYDERSFGELSASMALPETTLRKRKFDCLGKLRKMMDNYKLDL